MISPKLVFLDLGGRGIVISTKRKEKRGFKEKDFYQHRGIEGKNTRMDNLAVPRQNVKSPKRYNL